LCSDTHLS